MPGYQMGVEVEYYCPQAGMGEEEVLYREVKKPAHKYCTVITKSKVQTTSIAKIYYQIRGLTFVTFFSGQFKSNMYDLAKISTSCTNGSVTSTSMLQCDTILKAPAVLGTLWLLRPQLLGI